ncbi:MAG: FAD/NAD(P)-binding protein [Bacteroidetes bacterium]|nr:FAD/NAD(P)-binding protein [Bacteroidota bacterium]
MRKIAIVGGGFSGILLAVHLIRRTDSPVELIIIDRQQQFCKGIAYNTYSKKHILNVIASRMSAFQDQPDHFLDWMESRVESDSLPRSILGNTFVPRYLYAEYLGDIWNDALQLASKKGIRLGILDSFVSDLTSVNGEINLHLENNEIINVDYCVLATGNRLPAQLPFDPDSIAKSGNYFPDPWNEDVVNSCLDARHIAIAGNGLTMVDTVLGLKEAGYKGVIFTISPNGYNLLPHRHIGVRYELNQEQLNKCKTLAEHLNFFNRHFRRLKKAGFTSEPLIEALRPFTQEIWMKLNEAEKVIFLEKLKSKWDVGRHRIPAHIHDQIQILRESKQFVPYKGVISNIKPSEKGIEIHIRHKHHNKILHVSKVINCTGPSSRINPDGDGLLSKCLKKGILTQDFQFLGIQTDVDTYNVINSEGLRNERLFTLGPTLKGELWESIAVNELRVQAEKLAVILVKRLDP